MPHAFVGVLCTSYLFACQVIEIYRRPLRSQVLCDIIRDPCDHRWSQVIHGFVLVFMCDVCRTLINSLVCWFCTGAMGLFLFQIVLAVSERRCTPALPLRCLKEIAPNVCADSVWKTWHWRLVPTVFERHETTGLSSQWCKNMTQSVCLDSDVKHDTECLSWQWCKTWHRVSVLTVV